MTVETTTVNPAGGPLAGITLPTLDGGMLRLGDLRGTQALLFCWASW